MEMLSKLKPGDVLGQVDLASYIGAMAKGVAEAQKALDDNTIGLLGQFAQPIDSLAGKSLLALGLSPAFYHFRSATISASVSMSIRVRQEIDVKVHVEAGKSTDSTTKVTSGSSDVASARTSVKISQQQTATANASSQASAMEAIDSYSEQNSSASSHYVLAERLAVADKTSLTHTGLVRYSAQADLFAVVPKDKHWGVIGLAGGSGANEQFTIKAQPPFTPGPTNDAKALAAALEQHLTTGSGAIGAVYVLYGDGRPGDLTEVLFDTNSHVVKPVANHDYQVRLRALAQIIVAAELGSVSVTGSTDGVGPTDYNKRLSELRAKAVAAVLEAHGVTVSAATGIGEQGAINNQADQGRRKATVAFATPPPGCFIYVEDAAAAFAQPTMGPAGSATTNGLRLENDYPGSGTGTVANVSVTSAHELAVEINKLQSVEASEVGELVYLTNKESSGKKVAKVRVYAAENSSLDTSSSSDLTFDQAVSEQKTAVDTSETETNRAVAVAGSLDVRFSRMFDVSMAGNMSIAAELVSVPPPAEFLQFIKDSLGN